MMGLFLIDNEILNGGFKLHTLFSSAQITNSFYKALKYWVFTDYAQIHCRDSDAKLLNNFNYHMTGSKIQNWDFKINFCSTFLDMNTPSLQ